MVTMAVLKLFLIVTLICSCVCGTPTAMNILQDMYHSCIQNLSVSCVKPKALQWFSEVSDSDKIKITEDLFIVKKDSNTETESKRESSETIFDQIETFLETHDLVAKAPAILKPDGPLGSLVPRSFELEDVKAPLAVTGRSSKLIKKVIVPFLLGLKFKTAVVVPIFLFFVALKAWKGLTLGLLSLVLTGALIIFRLTKPKVVNYEVIHYPQHIEHHVEHPPISSGWEHPGYGRQLTGNEMAYNSYLS